MNTAPNGANRVSDRRDTRCRANGRTAPSQKDDIAARDRGDPDFRVEIVRQQLGLLDRRLDRGVLLERGETGDRQGRTEHIRAVRRITDQEPDVAQHGQRGVRGRDVHVEALTTSLIVKPREGFAVRSARMAAARFAAGAARAIRQGYRFGATCFAIAIPCWCDSVLDGRRPRRIRAPVRADGVIGWCIIDRPEARNAFTPGMYFGIRRAVSLVNADPDLAAMIITGTGDVFSSGGDLGGRSEPGDVPVPDIGPDILPFLTIRDSRAPVVAAVNGICQAGGLLIAMMADIAVASDRATFRVPELLRGIVDATYAAILPAHVGIAVARDLLLSARRFDAEEAVRLGVISRIAPHDHLREAARRSGRRDPANGAAGADARQAHAERPLRAHRLPDDVRLTRGLLRTP